MKRIFQLLFLWIIGIQLSHAQTRKVKLQRPSVILFALQKSTNKIEAYRQRGMEKEAQEVIATDEEINQSVMQDFKNNFTFCPVYFFYSSQLQEVIKQQWDKIVFYDKESLSQKKKIEVSGFSNYFIAEVNYPPIMEFDTVGIHNPISNYDMMDGDEPSVSTRNYGVLTYDETYQYIPHKYRFVDISLRQRKVSSKPAKRQFVFVGASRYQKALMLLFP
ncbi:MAG: hypothetical protein JNJ58_00725 [Chitinophagaceae bacterium]|nr:hypothetical protein [Chitinophagaceae bacterium]